MYQPKGSIEKGKKIDCGAKEIQYGLKQSPRQWNQRFDNFMKEKKISRSVYDLCVYIKGQNINDIVYLLLYVDDMLVASKDMKAFKK